jgi:hypothetical protein
MLNFINSLLPLVDRPKAAEITILNPWRAADFFG